MDNETKPNAAADALAWPPIPPEDLAKGKTITPERLRELGAMTGIPGTARWAFRLIRLRDEIIERSEKDGKPLSLRICKNGLHVNTDAEAVAYHNDRGENGICMIRRQVGMLAKSIDTTKLSSAEQAKLDRSLCVWGARMQGLKRAEKAIMEAPQGAASRGEAGQGKDSAPAG